MSSIGLIYVLKIIVEDRFIFSLFVRPVGNFATMNRLFKCKKFKNVSHIFQNDPSKYDFVS